MSQGFFYIKFARRLKNTCRLCFVIDGRRRGEYIFPRHSTGRRQLMSEVRPATDGVSLRCTISVFGHSLCSTSSMKPPTKFVRLWGRPEQENRRLGKTRSGNAKRFQKKINVVCCWTKAWPSPHRHLEVPKGKSGHRQNQSGLRQTRIWRSANRNLALAKSKAGSRQRKI